MADKAAISAGHRGREHAAYLRSQEGEGAVRSAGHGKFGGYHPPKVTDPLHYVSRLTCTSCRTATLDES